jgi:hypothetical protein
MKRYFKSLGAFSLIGILGFSILNFILMQVTINEYRSTGMFSGSGWDAQYYLFGIIFCIQAAIAILIVATILMGIVALIYRKNKETKIPVRFAWIAGGIFGLLWFFMRFGFDAFINPIMQAIGK